MQNLKKRFLLQDNSKEGTLQSCVRTNDLELVGDGTHLTHFQMLGNFSFGGNDYEQSIIMWQNILNDLKVPIDSVHIHPESNLHRLWNGYNIIEDIECEWKLGEVGGYCCEVYSNGIEIGNLVNPLGHSVDVGFGWERLLMIIEGKTRVDEISLFDTSLDPIVRDHVRTLNCFWENNIYPGNKGRNYICRRLIRRVLSFYHGDPEWIDWLEKERDLRNKCLVLGRKLWKRHKDKSYEWWWQTCGLNEEDMRLL